MEEEIKIPVAHCHNCDETGPVVVEQFDADFLGEDREFMAVYCPACHTVLNLNGNVEVKWYTPEELPKATGWKVESTNPPRP